MDFYTRHGFINSHDVWIFPMMFDMFGFPWVNHTSPTWYVGFGIPSDSHDSFQVRSQSRHHLDDGNDLPSTAISAISHYLTKILPFNPTNITLCNYIVGQKKSHDVWIPSVSGMENNIYPASSHRTAPPGMANFRSIARPLRPDQFPRRRPLRWRSSRGRWRGRRCPRRPNRRALDGVPGR